MPNRPSNQKRRASKAAIMKDGGWYIAFSRAVPGANGQGRTVKECRQSLAEAEALVLEDQKSEKLGRT